MPLDTEDGTTAVSCLRDLRDVIATDAKLAPARRRAITSDLDTLMRIQPATAALPPTPRAQYQALREFVRRADVQGLSTKRAQNIASNVRAALAWCQSRQLPIRTPRSAAWQILWDDLAGRGSNSFRKAQLSSFVRWSNEIGLEPTNVTDAAVAQFHEDLKTKRPPAYARDHVRALIRCWNSLAETRAVWPSVTLNQPPPAPRRGIPAAAYAPTFLNDLELYRQTAITGNLVGFRKTRFNENSSKQTSAKKNRPKSADSYVSRLRRAAVLLSSSRGQSLKEITSLRDLFVPSAPQDILEAAYDKHGESHYLGDLLSSLINVTKIYLQVTDECSARLRNLQDQLPQIEAVMCARNRDRLRNLSQADLAALYGLPKKLMLTVDERLKRSHALRRRDVSNAKAAAALSILLYTPPRLNNLSSIRLDQHLRLQDHSAWLQFSADETKQKRAWSAPVHKKSLPILNWYVKSILPSLGGIDPKALFPGRSKASTSNDQLRSIISRTLEEHVCALNPHFFRHLVAHIMLVEQPGSYHAVQLLLGHSNVETTKNFYCGEEAEAALRHIAECQSSAVDKLVSSIVVQPSRSMRRRSPKLQRDNQGDKRAQTSG